MGVPKGLQPSFTYCIDDTNVTLPKELENILNSCWMPNPVERPNVRELVNYMDTLQIPWVSNPSSRFWSLPVSSIG